MLKLLRTVLVDPITQSFMFAQRGSHNELATRSDNAQIAKPVTRARHQDKNNARGQRLQELHGPADCAERIDDIE